MSVPKRIDSEDTVDTAVHFLHRLQAEGWGVASIVCEIDHAPAGKHRLPVEAAVTITLIPAH